MLTVGRSASNDLSPLLGSAHSFGGDPYGAMAKIATLEARVTQIAKGFQPLQLDLVVVDLGFVRRELHR
jgi:hypothetical protein